MLTDEFEEFNHLSRSHCPALSELFCYSCLHIVGNIELLTVSRDINSPEEQFEDKRKKQKIHRHHPPSLAQRDLASNVSCLDK